MAVKLSRKPQRLAVRQFVEVRLRSRPLAFHFANAFGVLWAVLKKGRFASGKGSAKLNA
jgi:hypothetical protein